MRFRRIFTGLLVFAVIAACTTAARPDLSGMSFSGSPLIGKIVWHDLMTEDLAAARRFYGGLFGWQFEAADGTGRGEYIVARSGNVYVAGLVAIDRPADGSRLSRWLPYVSVDDVDDAIARGTQDGATIAATARNVSFGRVAALIDPQGAVIGLARSSIGDPDDVTTAARAGRPVWAELLAGDASAAANFYRSLVGYDVETIDRRGGEYTLLEHTGSARAGVLTRPDNNIDPLWLTFFGVDDPAAAAKRAEQLGGHIILDAAPEFRDGTVAIVADPSGAALVLQKWSVPGGEG